MRRAWRGSVSRVTYPRSWSTAIVFAAACLETDRRRPSSEALSAPEAMARMAKSWTGRTSSYPRRASSATAASTSERKPPSRSSARSAPERDMGEEYGSDWTTTTKLTNVWTTRLSNWGEEMDATAAGPVLPGITHHHAEVNGTTLHYAAAGTSGSPVLLV